MEDARPLLAHLTSVLHDVLGEAVRSILLHGSAVDGGLRPDSDVDLLVLVDRPLHEGERVALISEALRVSGARAGAPVGGRRPARPLELTVVAVGEVVPWRYPPRFELQYGEWLRTAAESGDPLGPARSADLAVLLTQARAVCLVLAGGPADEVLDPVPLDDLRQALRDSLEPLLAEPPGDERNVLLTLARMQVTAETGRIVPKDAAADLVLAQPGPSRTTRAALWTARDAYRSGAPASWSASEAAVAAHELADRVRRVLQEPLAGT